MYDLTPFEAQEIGAAHCLITPEGVTLEGGWPHWYLTLALRHVQEARLWFLGLVLLDARLDSAHIGLTGASMKSTRVNPAFSAPLPNEISPAVIPEDRRGGTKGAGELLVRRRVRKDGKLRDIDRDCLHFPILPVEYR